MKGPILMYLSTNLNFPNLRESQSNRVEKLCHNIYHLCREMSLGFMRCNVKKKNDEKQKKEDSNNLVNIMIKTWNLRIATRLLKKMCQVASVHEMQHINSSPYHRL